MKMLVDRRHMSTPASAEIVFRDAAQTFGSAVVDAAVSKGGADYRCLSAYSTILIAARRDFGGDLDRHAIYLVFAMNELSARMSGRTANGINALSVADITHIPRETVRRKLRELASLGDLRQGDDGLWYIDDTRRMERLAKALRKLIVSGVIYNPSPDALHSAKAS